MNFDLKNKERRLQALDKFHDNELKLGMKQRCYLGHILYHFTGTQKPKRINKYTDLEEKEVKDVRLCNNCG